MVLLGNIAGSNAASIDTFTTSGLVSLSQGIRVGVNNTHQQEMNTFQFGSVSVTGVTNTASKLVTVTYNQATTGTMFAMATAFYSGTASPLPALYVWIDNLTSTNAVFAIIADDDTPGTYNCQNHYWIFN